MGNILARCFDFPRRAYMSVSKMFTISDYVLFAFSLHTIFSTLTYYYIVTITLLQARQATVRRLGEMLAIIIYSTYVFRPLHTCDSVAIASYITS